jgi:hypothetical protein
MAGHTPTGYDQHRGDTSSGSTMARPPPSSHAVSPIPTLSTAPAFKGVITEEIAAFIELNKHIYFPPNPQ